VVVTSLLPIQSYITKNIIEQIVFSTAPELTAKEIGRRNLPSLNYQIRTRANNQKFKTAYSLSFGMTSITDLIPIV
jgi:hypothetical protein